MWECHGGNKYYNKKVIIDGIKFDSQKEGNRYLELKLLQRAGEIKDLKIHPRYLLQPSFEKNGKKYRKIEYVADFAYTEKNGNIVVEDTKGIETEAFKIKHKLFEYKIPQLELRII